MDKNDIINYKKIKDNTFTTSEVIRDSFVKLIKSLDKNDFILVENTRQKKVMVVQDIDTFVGINSKKIKSSNKIINFAKQHIKNNIYYLMRFESPNITFPEIETILDKGKVTTKMGFDAKITNQLMDGWKYVLYSPKKINVNQMIHLQAIIAKNQALEWGKLRNGQVSISGTNYEPPIIKQKDLQKLFDEFSKSKNKINQAGILLAKLIKMQPFWDGNKRTAFLTLNKLLIENKIGILCLNEDTILEFNTKLNKYYNDESSLKSFSAFISKRLIQKI